MTDGFPRLANAILGIIRSAAQQPAPDATTIREGIIASVREDGRATIRGYPDVLAPKSPTFKMAVGQRVHVAFRGSRPVLILGHNWKRAQAGQRVSRALVEELILRKPAARWLITFRNDQQFTDLDLDPVNDGNPTSVVWGARDDTFLVTVERPRSLSDSRIVPQYLVYQLNRSQGQPAGAAKVSATLVKTITLPEITLPSKFDSIDFIDRLGGPPGAHDLTTTPTKFPYLETMEPGSTLGQAVLTAGLEVAVPVKVRVTAQVTTPGPSSVGRDVYIYDYLLIYSSKTSSFVFESPATTEKIEATDYTHIGGLSARVTLTSFVIAEWSDADPLRQRVASSWAHWSYTTPSTTVVFPLSIVSQEESALFVERPSGREWSPRPWTLSERTLTPDLLPFADQGTPKNLKASPGWLVWDRHVLDASNVIVRFDGYLSDLTKKQNRAAKLLSYVPNLAAETSGLRGQFRMTTVRPMGTDLFILSENSLFAAVNPAVYAGTWPAATQRGRFATPDTLSLDLGLIVPAAPYVGIDTGRDEEAALIAYPTGTSDAIESARTVAYHEVGA